MNDIFQDGKKQGAWSKEEMEICGWDSAEQLLALEEADYQKDIAELGELRNPEYAEEHARFLEGVITGARESLRALIDEEK